MIYTRVELNEIEIYANVNGEKLQALRNKDTIEELISRGLLKKDRLLYKDDIPDELYSLYNGGSKPPVETLYVKIKHQMFC